MLAALASDCGTSDPRAGKKFAGAALKVFCGLYDWFFLHELPTPPFCCLHQI